MRTDPTKRQRIAAWLQLEAERAVAARVTARLKAPPAQTLPYNHRAAARKQFAKYLNEQIQSSLFAAMSGGAT